MTQAEEVLPSKVTSEVKFLADRMLGRLAKWLRVIGYDTVYARHLSPVGLMREARQQGRLILTRDTRLARYKDAPPFLFIGSDRFREQLKQVLGTLKLDPYARLLTRCVECNRLLKGMAKEKVKEKVPPYVWETQAEFVCCPGCQRIYWGATHKEHVLAELKGLGILAGEEKAPA